VESKLGPLGTAAIYCPIVPAPGDCEDGEFFGGMKIGKGNRSTRRKPTNPTWPDPGLNPGRRGGKPATNRLSYGAAFVIALNLGIVFSYLHMYYWLSLPYYWFL
jgi:hypothetical protein